VPLRKQLSIACAVSLALVAGLCFFLFREPTRTGRFGAEKALRVSPELPGSTLEETKATSREAAAVELGKEAAKEASSPPPDAVSLESGWTITGRLLREVPSGASVPAEGVAVYLKPHPRRTKPSEAPPPQKKLTGPDGRFELVGVPGKIALRVEIDEPSSAYRALGFRLADVPPQGTGEDETRKDLGDILLEPAMTLVVRLLGPKGEPAVKGTVLAEKSSSAAGVSALSSLGFNESRREAEERENGEYVLERAPPGTLRVEATAPGCAPSGRQNVELPRAEPLVIRLAEGRQIAGTVQSSSGKPIDKAELQVSGPNVKDPAPKVKTDKSGRFIFDTLDVGDYTVSATADGFASAQKAGIPSGTEGLEFSLAPEATFAGKVVADDDDQPVAKAKVNLSSPARNESFSAETDASGSFILRKLPGATYDITVDHAEFAPGKEDAREIEAGARIAEQVLRLGRGMKATGKVVDSETQAPIAEAQVSFLMQINGPNNNSRRSGKTGPGGSFEVKGLGEGAYSLTASAKGYFTSKPQTVAISEEGEKEFTLSLEQGSSISGRVLDSSGSPIPGAAIRPNISFTNGANWDPRMGSLGNLTARTDEEGRYRLDGLVPYPTYSVTASHPDYASSSLKGIAVGQKETVDGVDIKLSRGGALRGRVLDEKGTGIAGADISVTSEKEGDQGGNLYFGGSGGSGRATSDADGYYALKRIEPGVYSIRAKAKDLMTGTRDKIEVKEEGTAEGVDIVLGAGETLAGRVVDAEGNAVAGADINLYAEDSKQARTDPDGQFRVSGLRAGQVSLNLSKSGFENKHLQLAVPAKDVLLTLERAAKIAGMLRAKGQETFKPFQIMVSSRRGGAGGMENFFGSPQNDPSGKFEVEVSPGAHVLKVMVQGFAPSKSAEIKVKAGERVEGVTIDLLAGGTVRGVVVLRGSGKPVSGARVSYKALSSRSEPWESPWGMTSANTEPDGSFTLEGVTPGMVDLIVYHAQYAQGTLSGLQIREGEAAQVTVELGAGGGARGTVTRGGTPVAGARVELKKTDDPSQVTKEAMTDAQGRFEIMGLPPGDYLLYLSLPGKANRGSRRVEKQSLTVLEGQVSEIEIAEAEIASIRLTGRVLSGGEPLKGGRIQILQVERGFGGDQGQIDSSGFYSLEVPTAGTYFLVVQRKGEGGVKIEVTIPEGGSEFQHDIELPAGEISGEVVDAESGAAIVSAQVVAFPAGSASRSLMSLFKAMQAMAPTDSSGQFVISNLPPGTYSVLVVAQDYADGRLDGIEVDGRQSSRGHRIPLELGIPFRTRVVDRQGQPVPQAMALLRDQNGNVVPFSRPSFSDAEGILELSSVRPAVYQMTILHRAYAPARATIKVTPDGTEEPTLTVRPGGKVNVLVTNRQGRPVEGAEVEILGEKGENAAEELFFFDGSTQSTLTRSDGSLVVGPLAPGTYRAVAGKGKAKSREQKVSVSEGQTVEVKLRLEE
jgi:protocatechuate 3,4-dioxygenase beta subunit